MPGHATPRADDVASPEGALMARQRGPKDPRPLRLAKVRIARGRPEPGDSLTVTAAILTRLALRCTTSCRAIAARSASPRAPNAELRLPRAVAMQSGGTHDQPGFSARSGKQRACT
jgi:hypothetical protein